ncbi:DUF4625 domain-containing protein [Cellulophaga baltica]|uniref:DUF4625 domain-containing protein n=1 Tax=Cellulophaga TaxID=104264 RepID=UPI001C07C563|nr:MULTISPECIES: DUF4625 domain-containing protein [Cellulophaga]MBU2996325.1 DUF4625 domain-containing protein [Cellulophaga baltica]MDO6767720.1 DUF4625 domain-containing protein [Cellulophaga sp. 1_MG-2023]
MNFKINFYNRLHFIVMPTFLLMLLFTSCSSDEEGDETILMAPTISEVEVGLYDNELGVVGEDFHFNAEFLAGDLLDMVTINIEQRAGETYSSDWSFEMVWDKYQGLKNATMHQHFDIPAEAPKGVYDFVITVTDQNGTFLEEVRNIELIDAEDYPEVNPHLSVFGVDKINDEGVGGFNNFYNNGEYQNPEGSYFAVNESIWSAIQIGSIKGDGIMYGLLIKKSFNHKPESIEEIDFSKAIVTEVVSHYDEEELITLKNNRDTGHWNYGVALTIGAEEDNLTTPNPITDAKAWESGTYYYGVVYTNISYSRSVFYYIEFDIIME